MYLRRNQRRRQIAGTGSAWWRGSSTPWSAGHCGGGPRARGRGRGPGSSAGRRGRLSGISGRGGRGLVPGDTAVRHKLWSWTRITASTSQSICPTANLRTRRLPIPSVLIYQCTKLLYTRMSDSRLSVESERWRL